jgi:hypothetical protein
VVGWVSVWVSGWVHGGVGVMAPLEIKVACVYEMDYFRKLLAEI